MIKELLLKKALGKTEEDNIDYQKFILCKINNTSFVIKIEDIKEIVNILEISPVPGTDKYILGILNLRGLVVPIIDIRKKFGGKNFIKTPLSRYIIFDINSELLGILVDESQEIIEIEKDTYIEDKEDNEYFTHYVKHNNNNVGILNLKKIFFDYKI